jgi:hypothetical protein|tara:strand:+ start:318 stop:557 length:240 start_codon:yes stop_codon:yes gene_type:complete
MDDGIVLDVQQNIGDVGGNFSKSITVESGSDVERVGDVEAVIDLTYNIFQYIPELIFVSLYGLTMYAAVLLITKKIKGN